MDITQYKNVTVLNHPLLTHKIALLRDKNTPSCQFHQLVKEIALIEAVESLRNIKTHPVRLETPIEPTVQPMVEGKNIVFVPILRAGMGMLDGFLEVLPSARSGFIAMARDEQTHEAHEYYCKLPEHLEDKEVVILDPMLATGGSAIDAITTLQKHGAKHLRFVCIIAAPEGVTTFAEAYPEIPLFIGNLDRQLNSNAYICPGLGDAGDRIFNTVQE